MLQAACFRVGRQPRARDANASSRCARVWQQGAAGWAGLMAGFKCGVCRGSYCCGIDEPERLQWRLRARCSIQRATCSIQRATCSIQRAACNVQRAAPQHATHIMHRRAVGPDFPAQGRGCGSHTHRPTLWRAIQCARCARRAVHRWPASLRRAAWPAGSAARLGSAWRATRHSVGRACTHACVRAS